MHSKVSMGMFYLSMSMLAGLRGRHFYNFAGTSLQHDKAILLQGRALQGVGLRGTRMSTLEISVTVCHGGSQAATERHPEEHKCTKQTAEISNITQKYLQEKESPQFIN